MLLAIRSRPNLGLNVEYSTRIPDSQFDPKYNNRLEDPLRFRAEHLKKIKFLLPQGLAFRLCPFLMESCIVFYSLRLACITQRQLGPYRPDRAP